MSTADVWAGSFGDQYHARNRVDWRARIPFWQRIIAITGARSVYEFGCGPGWNLSAILQVNQHTKCYGYDVNQFAAIQAQSAGLRVDGPEEDKSPSRFVPQCDLSFTAGFLIHVPPSLLEQRMSFIRARSSHYVLAIEYYAEQEEEVEYRGQSGLLWKRNYGRLYQDMGLNLVASWGPERVQGFDNCDCWLLEKGD